MTATSFDTLKAARELSDAGIETSHAEAIAAVIREAAGADHATLASKADLASLEARIYRAMLLQAFAVAGIVIAAIKLL